VTSTVSRSGAVAADPMVPRTFTLLSTHADTRDTFTLELEPTDGQRLEFRAGQFTMLSAFGIGEVPISISGSPVEDGPLIHTIRSVGGVSNAIVSSAPGTQLGVRGPFGTSWDVTDAKGGDVVIITGGIGLAPLRPAILNSFPSAISTTASCSSTGPAPPTTSSSAMRCANGPPASA
jgi:NAD(P)H-flavin reductase